jgi:cadmium resistance protein CadD (predicted permease)
MSFALPPSFAAPDALYVSILATGFTAAFLHAALPTHWLPFVLVGRGQGWSLGRTLRAAWLAGGAHVLLTVVVGVVLVGVGMSLHERFDGVLRWVSGGALVALGLWYLVSRPPKIAADAPDRRFASDRAALFSLVAALAVYPSEAYLPVYLTAAPFGWGLFVILSAILLVTTLVGMSLFVAAAAAGANRLRLERFERYERLILAAALCGLGLYVLTVAH